MTRAVYPGSFDPITIGHEDIIRRAAGMFDELIVAVLHNSSKNAVFTIEEKIRMIETCVGDIGNIKIAASDGLLVDFVSASGAKIIVRGIRSLSDYDYEVSWAHNNSVICPGIETVFLPAKLENLYISSSTVREIAKFHGDISEFVNPGILDMINYKFTSSGGKSDEQN